LTVTGDYYGSNEQERLYFKMCLLQAEIALEGMKAQNVINMRDYGCPKYTEADFLGLIDKYSVYHNAFPFNKY